MSNFETINTLLQQIPVDLRLEPVLAGLANDGISMEEVLIMSNSLFKRNYHHDIEKTMVLELGQTKRKKLCFVINREGIYDLLPEDLFHQPADAQKESSLEEIIREIKWQNEIEQSSRNFFLPVEQEFYRLLVKLELEEEKFLFETSGDLSADLFEYLWNLPEFLDNLQKTKLGILMPALHRIVGRPELIKEIIESITLDRVELLDSPPSSAFIVEKPQMGLARLGDNTILGGRIFAHEHGKMLKIFLPDEADIRDYFPGGKKIIIHEFLCNLLMPFETDITFDLNFSRAITDFELENEDINKGRLSYTTFI